MMLPLTLFMNQSPYQSPYWLLIAHFLLMVIQGTLGHWDFPLPSLLCKYAQVLFQVLEPFIVCLFKLSKRLALVQNQVLYFVAVHMLKSLYDVKVILMKQV